MTTLRSTAPPTAFDTTKPTRTGAVWVGQFSPSTVSAGTGWGCATCTTNRRLPARLPFDTAREKSLPRRIRCRAGSTATTKRRFRRDPCGAGLPGWLAPRGCAYADGSRAPWRACDCWAGRSACSRLDSGFLSAGTRVAATEPARITTVYECATRAPSSRQRRIFGTQPH